MIMIIISGGNNNNDIHSNSYSNRSSKDTRNRLPVLPAAQYQRQSQTHSHLASARSVGMASFHIFMGTHRSTRRVSPALSTVTGTPASYRSRSPRC